jgi:hypothetical protein
MKAVQTPLLPLEPNNSNLMRSQSPSKAYRSQPCQDSGFNQDCPWCQSHACSKFGPFLERARTRRASASNAGAAQTSCRVTPSQKLGCNVVLGLLAALLSVF